MSFQPFPVEDHGDYWINAAGRRIPKEIPGYGKKVVPFAGAFATQPPAPETCPPFRPTYNHFVLNRLSFFPCLV